jgi:predicted Zn-dependent peptidase
MNAVTTLHKETKTTTETSHQANAPMEVQMQTLPNGLKLYMSVNKNEPRINTNIVVRAGAKNDPPDTTGLAHYLEHMMFKGTSQIGSLDWDKERELLSQIAELYEKHRVETDIEVRQAYYAQIDTLSNKAAQYVAANEYDNLIGSLGARGTNAFTSTEQTVYVADIPSNELEKWFQLEAERFKMVVLRLFHTELETVYEEFNIGQDEDRRKVYQTMMAALFPAHPYGTQTIIGKGEHLKNPSHYNIQKFYSQYYVPNNMAIVLAGDFEPTDAIRLTEKYFGSYESKYIPPFTFENQPPLSIRIKKEVLGQQSSYLQLAWRLGGANTQDADFGYMIAVMLYNQQAGLIDLNLVQQQRVLDASAGFQNSKDYTVLSLTGKPREGQSLEEVEKLLINQVNLLKKGDFPNWLLEAVVTDFKYSRLKSFENNQNRAGAMTDVFVKDMDWDTYVSRIERMKNITKQHVVDFANLHFNDNYVVVYKQVGDDKTVMKVDKPKITPVQLNRTNQTAFATDFLTKKSPRIKPEFIDFKAAIQTFPLRNGVELDYIPNKINETFSLYYIFEMGKSSDKILAFAVNYLTFLGTNTYSAAQLQQEFYKLGLTFDVFSNDERSYVVLSGLEENFTAGVRLFEHILQNVIGDKDALNNMIADILAKRDNDKKDKRIILRHALHDYAVYGKKSPFIDILSKTVLQKLSTNRLVAKIKSLTQFQHRVFYYGAKSPETVTTILCKEHHVPTQLTPTPPKKVYLELDTRKDSVLFAHYPMVQTEIMLLSKGTPQYSEAESIMSVLFNNYFGIGMSSIVFQEIREARALAYAANAYCSTPDTCNEAHYLQAYVGTQPDKLQEAINAMRDIMEDMPLSEAQFEQAKLSVLKSIESERITKASVYWTYLSSKDKGVEYDVRKPLYETISKSTLADLKAFHQQYIKGRHFTYLILGDKERIDFAFLKGIGKVKELELGTLFGY